jgi:hypothetical protein
MAELEPGFARMSHPDPGVKDAIVKQEQVPHLENVGWRYEEGDRETWPVELQRFEGQPQRRIYHPGLDRYEVVADSQVGPLRSVGWMLAEEADAAKVEQEADVLSEKTLDQLKDEARVRDLPVSGTKPELVERIRDHDTQQQAQNGQAGEQPAPDEEE